MNIHALMWRALRGVDVPAMPAAARGVGGDDEEDEGLPSLWEVMWRAARGEEPDLSAVSPTLRTPRLLAAVRRAFLDLVASLEEGVDLRQILRVLQAIERVEEAVERDEGLAPRAPPSIAAIGTIAEVAHDLRSPLGSIVFLADGLRRGGRGPLTDAQRRDLDLIHSAASTLSALADDLVSLERGADRLLGPAPVPFCVSDVVTRTLDVVRPTIPEDGPALRVVLPERDCRVGHPIALARVLLNLTGNAVRHTPRGHVEVAAVERSETVVRFSVRDTGPGLPDELRERLTSRRAGTRRADDEPTTPAGGLGLVISRRLVAAMGGELAVETPADGGTRLHFDLDLPLAL